MYPAENGDSFLLCANGINILVDGGYARTFDNYILNDLKILNTNGESLDLLITTHIDADHIGGIVQLLSMNGSSDESKIIPIRNIWHNSLRSLTSRNELNIPFQPGDLEVLNAIKRRGHPVLTIQTDEILKEISAKQGSTLASLIHSGGYSWNGSDGAKAISFESNQNANLKGGLVNVITPSKLRLNKLLKFWQKNIRNSGYRGPTGSGDFTDDAFEFTYEHLNEKPYSAPSLISAGRRRILKDIYTPDTSITNGSSIATIISLGGMRLLMLADAWAEDVLEALLELKSSGVSMSFDGIKISHHGSFRNTSPELLGLIDAPNYFISSNGSKHNHPDIELLVAIVERPANFPRTLYFNYSTTASNEIREYKTKSATSFSVVENATDWIKISENELC
ncbi:AVAST type 1 anti-phage system MBL fold metallo-hydrolase Avs1a [Marinicellulosiphila megalodicopiae]|uniref:AVAST type 1 anti-phage system MBL fold metallo-hydrolase Avs1a n=1 Tax=Marinicellulosiphila megalodicopiae TaxID=2724896 RepID=UPI003BB1AF57